MLNVEFSVASMKIIKTVEQKEVWDHWKKIEGFSNDNFRTDIRNPLPTDPKWHLSLLESIDIEKLYIISSDDWRDVSKNTFLVKNVAENLETDSLNKDTIRIINNIKEKINFIKRGGIFDTRLIIVTDNLGGPYTIIEGNKRAVALLSCNLLTEKEIYLGISNNICNYVWARHTYPNL